MFGMVWKKQKGNVGELMVTGICILAMMFVMVSYFDVVSVLNQKEEVGQIARKYILRMETMGSLTATDRVSLTAELESAGVSEIVLDGSTMQEADYGEPIVLHIQGKLRGEYDFTEKRVSTAKN